MRTFSLLFLCGLTLSVSAQDSLPVLAPEEHFNPKRFKIVLATEALLTGGTLVGLSELWYKDYPKTAFHSFNDSKEWMGLDKCGHFSTAYYVGLLGVEAMKWAGIDDRKGIWYGGLWGWSFLMAVEVLDGFSEGWGFSWADALANTAGASLVIGQEMAWKEQRIMLKYSYHISEESHLRPNLFGHTNLQKAIKDYNGYTFWVTANVNDFTGNERIPEWLNLAMGYSATGMLTGMANDPALSSYPCYERTPHYYLSFDVDLFRVKTRHRWLNTLINTFGFIKFPAPALHFTPKEGVNFIPLYF